MGVTLNQVLGAKNITGIIQGVKPGLREKILPPALLTPTRKVEGNYGTYHKVTGERRAARTVAYGAPAVVYEPTGIGEVPVNFLHSFQQMHIEPAALTNLLAEGDENRQKLGMETVARQTGDFAMTFRNLRVASIFQMLATGTIKFDVNGNLTTGTAANTVDFGIPASNKNQLNVPRYDINGTAIAGAIIDATWATASNSILKQLQNLREAAVQMTGYPIELAFCGKNIKRHLFNNTEFKDYAKRNLACQEAVLANKIPANFADLTWYEMTEAFYATNTANDGSALTKSVAKPIFDPDTVVFTPQISSDWYELIEGSYPVPAGEEEGGSASEILNRFQQTYGHFGFAKRGIDANPSVIVEFQGDTFLPVIKVPYAVFIAKVVF